MRKKELNEKKASVWLDEEFHRQVKAKLAQAGSSFQDFMEGALRDYLHGKREHPAPPQRGGRFHEDLSLLEWALEHGSAEDRDHLRRSVRLVADAVRGRSPNPLLPVTPPAVKKRA